MMGMQQPNMGMQQPNMGMQQPNMGMQQPSGMVRIHQPSGMMGTQMGNMPLDITPDTTYTPSEKKKPEPQHHAAFDQFKMF
jgi:flagellar motor switch protein FliN/FliY